MSDADVNLVLEALERAQVPAEQIQQARLQLESQKPKRKDMQDYSMFGLYLLKALWDRIENPKEEQMAILDAIVQYLCETLGPRCPNELTQGTLCGLLVCKMSNEEREKYKSPHALRTFFLTCKSRIASRTAKYRKLPWPGNSTQQLLCLPSDREQLPELSLDLQQPRISMADVFVVAREIVCRKNGEALQLPQLELKDPLHMMQGFFQGMMAIGNVAAVTAMNHADLRPKSESPLTLLLNRAQNTAPCPNMYTRLGYADCFAGEAKHRLYKAYLADSHVGLWSEGSGKLSAHLCDRLLLKTLQQLQDSP